MPIVPITSQEDPRLDDYRDVREADLVGRRGIFLLEGLGVVRVFVASRRWPVRSLFLSEKRVAALADTIDSLGDDVPVYVAPQGVMDGVVGFDIHRGVLASGSRGTPHGLTDLLKRPGPRLLVACEGLTNHDNIGGVFRNAAAFGADAVVIDHTTCDPLYRKAIRVSVGGALLVPFARAHEGEDLVTSLVAAGFHVVALTPDLGAVDLSRVPFTQRTAILVGSEGPGLSSPALDAAHVRARISMAPGFDSLNVATACGIALYAARTSQRRAD